MYRLKLLKESDLNSLLEWDFASPMAIDESNLEEVFLKELNKKVEGAHFPELDAFEITINYTLEVCNYISGKSTWEDFPLITIYPSVDNSKFYKSAELIFG